MGAWGVGIRQDDFVLDVEGTFEDQLKDGKTIAEATGLVKKQFATTPDDCFDEPLFWLALADVQWKYGDLDPMTLQCVNEIVDAEIGMDLWGSPSDKLYKQRKAVLERFRNKISQPNPNSSRPPKRVIRKPKFKAGDCLLVKLENGQYSAALVLKTDNSSPEHGMDLVGELDYLSDMPPKLNVFTDRRWLTLKHLEREGMRPHISWYQSLGFRKVKSRITVLGNIPILDTDPEDSSTFFGWHLIGKHVQLQREWEAEQNA
jgi:hypothetical protein